MRYLIIGAGTIGTTLAWLFSKEHEVDVLVKQESYERLSAGATLLYKDMRKKAKDYVSEHVPLHCVTQARGPYDGILVAVNRVQLRSVLPTLEKLVDQTNYFAFLQNNWDIQAELSAWLPEEKYIVAFPSHIGGGREHGTVQVILFDEAVRLGGLCSAGIQDLQGSLAEAGVRSEVDRNIFAWLKVHYLQQSVTAGAILESGGYLEFARDGKAVKKMVLAFREGIQVCRASGLHVNSIFPVPLFRLPTSLVAHMMQKMFLEQNTREMVCGHMKKGLPEWAVGYNEVLAAGLEYGLPMRVWGSYQPYVEHYLTSFK